MGEQEIRSRLSSVQLLVGQAAQALSAERNLPGELRDYIQKLDRHTDRISEIVTDMELLGARARRVCSSGLPLSGQMKSAVNHMHDELVQFKMRLH